MIEEIETGFHVRFAAKSNMEENHLILDYLWI